MIASLPMYERPDNRDAHDRYWNRIRSHLGDGPESLLRDDDVWGHWRSPDLMLSQTCGMPYRNHLHGKVQLVGTPDYGLCDQPGYYNSSIITRRGDAFALENYTDRTFAYNERGSQSGWAAPLNHFADRGLDLGPRMKTGAHLASIAAVSAGEADICAVDALTFELAKDCDEVISTVQVIDETEPTPGLPYITSNSQDVGRLADAVGSAIDGLSQSDRQKLRLKGLVQLTAAQYLQIANPAE